MYSHSLRPYTTDYIFSAYSLLTFFTVIIFGIIHIFTKDNAFLGFLEILCGGVVLFNLLTHFFIRNNQLARHLLTIIILTILMVMLCTGGVAHTGIYWFFLFPVAAFFLTGKQGGVLWMCGLLLFSGFMLMLQSTTFINIPYTYIEVQQMLVALFVLTIGIYVYQSSRESLELQTKTNAQDFQAEKIKADLVIENIDEGVVVTSDDGAILFLNKAAQKLLRWKLEDIIGKKFTEVVPMVAETGEIIPAEKRPIQRVLKKKLFLEMAVNYKRKDGTIFPAAIAARAIVIDGRIRGAVGTLRDISEEKAIDREKSEFVTLASHQLRTPISAISWVSELLLHGDVGKLSTEQLDYVQQIYHSSERMAVLVDALLMTSSLEMGASHFSADSVNIGQIARRAVKKLSLEYLDGDAVHVQEHYDPLPTLMLNEQLTKAIIYKLLTNAFKYTKRGTVSLSIVKDTSKKLYPNSAGSIVIEVADTGIGIPTHQQDKLFTKLFRAENVKETDTDGTGLGLYIAKLASAAMGGDIAFTSTENKGSTFRVTLPLEGMTDITTKQGHKA